MKKIDANLNYLAQNGDITTAEIRAAVDANMSAENKGKWAAEVIRDALGKVIKVNVNLPDSVTDNEKANAVNAINANRGVASVSDYPKVITPVTLIESLPLGEKEIPGYIPWGGNINTVTFEGITSDQAHTGVKSYGALFTDLTKIHRYDAYQNIGETVSNTIAEYWIRVDSTPAADLEGSNFGFGAGLTINANLMVRYDTTWKWQMRFFIRDNAPIDEYKYIDITPGLWYKVKLTVMGNAYAMAELYDASETYLDGMDKIAWVSPTNFNIGYGANQTIATASADIYVDELSFTKFAA